MRCALLLTALVLGWMTGPVPVAAGEGRAPPVINQSYDDDCGVAALRMLLQRGGVDVTDAQLLAGLTSDSEVAALSARDLREMVAGLGLGVRLDIGFVPVAQMAEFAARRPFVVLFEPRGIGGGLAFDHYVVIEGRIRDRFLASDPLLSERVSIADDTFAEYTRGKTVEGRPHVMVLRLVGADGGDPLSIASRFAPDTRLRGWKQAYELPRLLPVGKMQVSVDHSWQRDRFGDGSPLVFESEGSSTVLDATIGLRTRTQAGIGITRDASLDRLSFSDIRFTDRQDDAYGVRLHVDHLPDIPLPPDIGLLLSAAVQWNGDLGASVGAQASWNKGPFTAGLGLDAFYDTALFISATPSIRYRFPAVAGFVADATFQTPFAVERSAEPTYQAQLSVGRQFGEDLHLGVYAGTRLFEEDDLRNFRIGIRATYGIPRRFR